MQSQTWKADYVGNFNAISEITLGSTNRSEVVLAAAMLTLFKRLVDHVIAHPLAPNAAASPQLNPFDLTTR